MSEPNERTSSKGQRAARRTIGTGAHWCVCGQTLTHTFTHTYGRLSHTVGTLRTLYGHTKGTHSQGNSPPVRHHFTDHCPSRSAEFSPSSEHSELTTQEPQDQKWHALIVRPLWVFSLASHSSPSRGRRLSLAPNEAHSMQAQPTGTSRGELFVNQLGWLCCGASIVLVARFAAGQMFAAELQPFCSRGFARLVYSKLVRSAFTHSEPQLCGPKSSLARTAQPRETRTRSAQASPALWPPLSSAQLSSEMFSHFQVHFARPLGRLESALRFPVASQYLTCNWPPARLWKLPTRRSTHKHPEPKWSRPFGRFLKGPKWIGRELARRRAAHSGQLALGIRFQPDAIQYSPSSSCTTLDELAELSAHLFL